FYSKKKKNSSRQKSIGVVILFFRSSTLVLKRPLVPLSTISFLADNRSGEPKKDAVSIGARREI
ncbi:hypothetical protein, partial [Flavobacterium sp. CGRL2]